MFDKKIEKRGTAGRNAVWDRDSAGAGSVAGRRIDAVRAIRCDGGRGR